jgi:ParB/RepB/Spo0J family partition protein
MGSYKIPFELISTDRFPNYRWEMGDIKSLMDSIERVGLQNPLKVRVRRGAGDDKNKTFYDLIDGRRRYTAIQRIRAKDPKQFVQVPAILFEGNEMDAYFAMFELNEQAKPHSPVEVADWIRMMVTKQNQKLVEVAQRIGISQSWASRLLKVRNQCHQDVLVAVNKNIVPFSLAEEWSEFPEDKQLVLFRKFTAVKDETGDKKKANTAGGKKKVLSWKAIVALREAAGTVGGDYYKGYADGCSTCIGKGPVPEKVKEVIKKQLSDALPKKRVPKPKKEASKEKPKEKPAAASGPAAGG